jgi:hypothetical protein
MTIAFPIGGPMDYPTNTWQELNWHPAYNSPDFFWFCSNVTASDDADKNSTAIDFALAKYTHGKPWTGLANYARYVKQVLIPMCPSLSLLGTTRCFGTQNGMFNLKVFY